MKGMDEMEFCYAERNLIRLSQEYEEFEIC